MIHYQKINLNTKFEPPITPSKNGVILQKYAFSITMMTSLTRNQFIEKIAVNTNLPVKFGVPMTFGLRVLLGQGDVSPPSCKCLGQITSCVK